MFSVMVAWFFPSVNVLLKNMVDVSERKAKALVKGAHFIFPYLPQIINLKRKKSSHQ